MQKQKAKPSTSTKRKGGSAGRTTAKAASTRRTVKAPKAPSAQTSGENDRAVREQESRKNEQLRVTNADEQKKALNTSTDPDGDDEEFENRYEGEDEEDEGYSSLRTSADDPSKESDDSEKVRKEIPRMS